MPSKLPQFTIRINPLLLKKLRYIADYNGRSANREVEVLIKEHVAGFEKKNGTLKPGDLDETVLPSGNRYEKQ